MNHVIAPHPDIVVIGAGAAGIFAACRAAEERVRVLLLERNRRIGTKILISGGGKCNLTHDGPMEDILHAFQPAEARFLRPSLYRLPPQSVLDRLQADGIDTTVREDGRIFPSTGNARNVVAAMESWLHRLGVTLQLGARVNAIDADDGKVTGVQVDGRHMPAAHIVLATGGASYPATGSTGDGYRFAAHLGHTIAPIHAALAPIDTTPCPPAGRAGIAIRDCLLRARTGSRELARHRGDVLFTHRGVSGPAVLAISGAVAEASTNQSVDLLADLLPDQPYEALQAELAAFAARNPRRRVLAFVESIVPHRLAPDILTAAAVPADCTCAHLHRDMRNRLVATLKGWSLGEVSCVPLERGEVVAGGVSLDEVDPQTMRSRVMSGLYLCGEVLDIAGPVGGYNLQAAFSTGWIAGETAARDALAAA